MIYKDNIDQMEEDLAEYAYRDSHRKDEGEDIEQKYYKAILKKTTIH
jgi:hypothetical protein